MNRTTTALLAALEALIVVAIGVGIALVPLTILWATHFELAVDWSMFWQAAANVWLLGNGVDLSVTLPAVLSAPLGLPGAEAPFGLTIALLGFTVLAVALGVRTGIRAIETPHPLVGVLAATLSYAVFATLITLSAVSAVVTPSLVQGIVLPTLIYAAGVLLGATGLFGRGVGATDTSSRAGSGLPTGPLLGVPNVVRERYRALPLVWRSGAAEAVRGGIAATTLLIGVAAVTLTVLVFANFATVIGLYEALQAGIMGGVTLTLAQLAILPNLVLWVVSWFVGPGFAIGAGSSVSPLGTSLGVIPGLPIFGALPHGTLAFGFLGLLMPVLIGFLAARLVRRRSDRLGLPVPSLSTALYTGVGTGVVAGVLLGLAMWASAGSFGPGRLVEVGPNPLVVGVLAAVEIGIAACLGMCAGIRRPDRSA
nr:DUF6350 family protein [Leifsonia psychrotolerans]